ncbi:hypothetical protein [Dactylosporangium sp. NPDC051541]|uniref:hypothetical protein n=1 Tax=Dactylosporangium sp. NPDC051541 TaxID=3363977 RepID=UPI0037AD748F
MSTWLCFCGNVIRDREAPNPNGFRLYSAAEVDEAMGETEDIARGDAPTLDNRFWVRDRFSPLHGTGLFGLRCDGCYRLLMIRRDRVVGVFRPELDLPLDVGDAGIPFDVITDGRWSVG